MVNYRFLSATSVKVLGLLCASVCAWYLGYLFAEILPEDSLQTAIGSIQQIGAKPLIRAPKPMRQKCAVWRKCSSTEIVYRVRSGAGKNVLPEICMDDKILLGGSLETGNRGINFVLVSHKTMEVTATKTFDMYEGDFSGPMVDFMSKIPDGSIILVATHDDAASKLSDAAKKAFEDLGSKDIRKLQFRSQWVFLGLKGGTVPENIEREKDTPCFCPLCTNTLCSCTQDKNIPGSTSRTIPRTDIAAGRRKSKSKDVYQKIKLKL